MSCSHARDTFGIYFELILALTGRRCFFLLRWEVLAALSAFNKTTRVPTIASSSPRPVRP